jgi:hypothetical protein
MYKPRTQDAYLPYCFAARMHMPSPQDGSPQCRRIRLTLPTTQDAVLCRSYLPSTQVPELSQSEQPT